MLGLCRVKTQRPSRLLSLAALGGPVDDGLGQAGQVLGLVDDEREGVGLLEDVVAELDRQDGELLVDLAELRLGRLVEVRAAPDEALVAFFEEPRLLRRQLELVPGVIDGLVLGEELRVEGDVVAVLGEQGRDLGLHRLEGGIRVPLRQAEEDVGDPGQERAAALDGLDRVGERGRLGIRDDRFDLLDLAGHSFPEGGHVVLVPDPVERRRLERRAVGFEEGVRRLDDGGRFRFRLLLGAEAQREA